MIYHSSQILSVVDEVRRNIPTILASMEADAYLKANVEKREENTVVVIVGLKPITSGFPRDVNLPDKLDELYGLIEQAVLEKAKDFGVGVQSIRENW
jgi:hypothetical protein